MTDQDTGQVHSPRTKFGKVPEAMMHNAAITDGAIRLYAHMHWRYGSNQQNFEGRESMAGYLKVSETTISKRTAELEVNDWIVVEPRPGRKSNFYHVFVSQKDCQRWREKSGIVKPEHSIKPRKSRKGIGGKPSHGVNLSLPVGVNLSSHTSVKLSSQELDSREPDSEELDSVSLSPVAIAPATEGESNKQINAVLEVVQKEQEAAAPSSDLILPEEKVSTPAAAPTLLPKGTEARYVSRKLDPESWTHVEHLVGANVAAPDPVCQRCKEKLNNGAVTQVPALGVVYVRCLEKVKDKKPKVPPINKPLLDAIAEYIEGIEPNLAGGLTGTLAGMAGQVWKRKLGISTLNAEQYNSIARSIPRFLEWYNKECEGCSPPKTRNKFESWYAKFCSGPITVKAPADESDLTTKKAEETKQAMREAYGFEV